MNRRSYLDRIKTRHNQWVRSIDQLESYLADLSSEERDAKIRELASLKEMTADLEAKLATEPSPDTDDVAWEGMCRALDDAAEKIDALIADLESIFSRC